MIKGEDLIDIGSYGEVYGPFKWREKNCAVKRIAIKADSFTIHFKENLEKKSELWISLSHENLTEILRVSLNGSILFVFMEYVGGGSLRNALNTHGSVPIIVLSDWAKQIADGMSYLHERNIVHRDLKSSNVLLAKCFDPSNVDAKITVKIADFDEMREHSGTVTMTFKGTLGWMAPEVLLKERFSKSSDVWSYGVVVWEMLTGDVPHKDLSLAELTDKAKSGTLALSIPESIPEMLSQLLKYCLRLENKGDTNFRGIEDFLRSSNKAVRDTDIVLIIGPDDGSTYTNDVLKINLHTPSEMYYVEEVPTSMRSEFAAATLNNTVYIVGLGKYANEIWRYEYRPNSGWHECASLIQPRRRHSVAFVDEVLYICGGFVKEDDNVLCNVEAYNSINNTCSSAGELVFPVQMSGNCVSYKKKLHIFGGADKDFKANSDVQVYDTVQNKCLKLPMPVASRFMRAALWKESVILLGRRNCFIYNLEAETWDLRKQFKTNVANFGLALSNDRIYIIGGGTSTTNEEGKVSWTCSDDIRSIAIEKIIENKPVEWIIHDKLPKPCMVTAIGVFGQEHDDTDAVSRKTELLQR